MQKLSTVSSIADAAAFGSASFRSLSDFLKFSGMTFIISVLALAGSASAQLSISSPPVMREVVRGSDLRGANGLAFDEEGKLYIASVLGREIVVMDSQTGRIVNRLNPEDGVESPDDLAFGPDGSLYWTALNVGYVGRRRPDGVVTTQFVAPGVNPITFSGDGRLFVGLDFLGDGLYELDPDLTAAPRPIIVPSVQNPYPLGFLNGFDFGPDGRLYGPIWTAGIIVSLNIDSCENTSNPWVDCDIQIVASGFSEPAAVKFSPENELHVIDQTGGVFAVDTSTGAKFRITTLRTQQDNLAFDSDGRLFVSNFGDGSVTQILPSGTGRVVNQKGLTIPGGVAVMAHSKRESVYVADYYSLREFDGRTGNELGVTLGQFLSLTGLYSPFTVSVDGDSLVVSSMTRGAVQKWDPETRVVTEQYQMAFPVNAIAFREGIAVADPVIGGVVWANSLETIVGPPYVYFPTGIAADENTLWVADWVTGTVWQVDHTNGTPVPPVLIASGLSYPEGLALDVDGTLLVVESGAGRLSRIDPDSSEITIVADRLEIGIPGLPGIAPTWAFNGVAVGPSGAVYVTGDKGNVVYRIWPRSGS